MKCLVLVGIILVLDHVHWSSSLELRRVDNDAFSNLRHRSYQTSKGTLISNQNLSNRALPVVGNVDAGKIEVISDPAKVGGWSNVGVKAKKNKEKDHTLQPMISTAHGICMYALPSRFNVDLLNSSFSQIIPQPHNISPSNEPPLQGMFDTLQFSFERIFYDRFVAAAQQRRPAKDCVMFYVPYFVAWETSAVQSSWKHLRAARANELLKHLAHYNDSLVPGRNHFIAIGRISLNVVQFLNDPIFTNMVKLTLEDTTPGQYPNVFAVPYPTWFRYYPGLEPEQRPRLRKQPTIQVNFAAINFQLDMAGCNSNWLGNLTSRIRTACDGRDVCSYHIVPELDHWVVGQAYEAMDANGKWWPVTLKSSNADGTCSVDVRDGPARKMHWLSVHKTHMRRHGQMASEAGHAATLKCPALDIFGSYTCGGATSYAFKSLPGRESVGHAVVLGCPRGPCWLLGTCGDKKALTSARTQGPLLTIIGSARSTEYERQVIFQMCEKRPQLCSAFHTGARENSTSFVQGSIADMYQLLMASTFCINPPGDTPTRKGLFDSLVLGCIPVVTSEDSLQHYSFHLPFWRSVSVLVTTDQLFSAGFNLVDFLESYAKKNPEEVLQKQAAISRHAYSLQYSLTPASVRRGSDAFDTILDKLLGLPISHQSSQDFDGVYAVVNVASGRRLFAQDGGDYTTGFGASTSDSGSDYQKWRIVGRGDGKCCYSLINMKSKRALYAGVNTTDYSKLGASTANNAAWADQRWRFLSEGSGSYALVNAASGRRLFALSGHEGNDGIGATIAATKSQTQSWTLEKVK